MLSKFHTSGENSQLNTLKYEELSDWPGVPKVSAGNRKDFTIVWLTAYSSKEVSGLGN